VQTKFDNLDYTVESSTNFTVDKNEPELISFSPANGVVGAPVTITGKNFSATSSDKKVLMDGLPATVTSSSTTQIIFVVPVGATTGNFSVQTVYNQLQRTVTAPSNLIIP